MHHFVTSCYEIVGVGVSGYLSYVTLKIMCNISTLRSKNVNYSVSTTRVAIVKWLC